MVTLHEVITFLVSMQISISSLQTHNVNRCGRSRHLARKLSLRRKRSSPNVFEMAATETITSIILIRSEERFSRNAETDLVCRLLLEKKKTINSDHAPPLAGSYGERHVAIGDEPADALRHAGARQQGNVARRDRPAMPTQPACCPNAT